ncbi:MAG TPA: multicopper oxidase domain-containing protein [Gemmatimonadaceae bacterium]|jgi:nitrite reductase (NO-forming)
MKHIKVVSALAITGVLAIGVLGLTDNAIRANRIERTDFDKVITATTPVYDATLPEASDAGIKEFRIPIKNATIEIADGVKYQGWTFGGTVPGPVIHVRQGDHVRVNVVNEADMPHSIDFHAAQIAANVAYRMIMPKDSVAFEFIAREPGAFMVHCGTPPVTMHIMQGMYLPIIVDPRGGWGTKADKEFVIVQSEFYTKPTADSSVVAADWDLERAKQASYVVFNGRARQYVDHPLKVNIGDRVRFYVVNAGPNFNSDFHIVGAMFDRVYPDGNPAHALEGVQTYPVPAGGGVVFEAVFDKDGSGEGLYPFVTHSFADAEKGAVGMIQVGVPKQFATMSH